MFRGISVKHIAFIAGLFVLAAPALAQDIEIIKKDDERILGYWQGTRNGFYLVEVKSILEKIPEKDVKEVSLLGNPARPGDLPSQLPARGYLEVRVIEQALRDGDFPRSFRLLSKFQEHVKQLQYEADTLYHKVHTGHLLFLIRKRDVAGMMKRILEFRTMPKENQRTLVELLTLKLEEHLRREPTTDFTAELAEGVAAYLSSETPMKPEVREHLLTLLGQIAFSQAKRKRYGTAAAVYAGLLRVQPEKRDELMPRIVEARFAHARQMRDLGNYEEAVAKLRLHLEDNPGDRDGYALLEEILFTHLRKEVDASPTMRARAMLEEYVSRPHPKWFQEWAEQKLAMLKEKVPVIPVAIAREIEKYYPLQAGRWMLYRRAEGTFMDKIYIDSISEEEGVVRVYQTVEEIFQTWKNTRTFRLDIEENAITRMAGDEKETLLRFPLQKDDSWSWGTHQHSFTRTVESMRATVTVPYGTFTNCAKVEFQSTLRDGGGETVIKSTSYYAPNVGLVKLEFAQSEYKKQGLELIDVGRDGDR